MSIKEEFMKSNLLIKIALIVVLVAQLFSWIAFTTSSWETWDYNNNPIVAITDGAVGLWRKCTGISCSFVDGTNNDNLAATQAFGIFGFVSLNLGCLLLVLTVFYEKCKGNSEATLASGISLIVSGVTWLIAVIIFAASFHESSSYNLDFSFALAVCALVLAAVAGVLVLVSAKGGTSVGSK